LSPPDYGKKGAILEVYSVHSVIYSPLSKKNYDMTNIYFGREKLIILQVGWLLLENILLAMKSV